MISGLLEVVGAKLVPPTGPLIMMANHASRVVDGLLVQLASPRRTMIVAHAAIATSVFLRPFFPRSRVIVVDDSLKSLKEMVDRCCASLAEGWTVLIFPEGRTMGDGIGSFRTGAGYVAARANCAATPVRITRPSTLRYRVSFGEALAPPTGIDRASLKAYMASVKDHISTL